MDFKKSNAQPNVQTLDIKKMTEGAENIYQAVIVCAKRANQISVDIKQELSQKLEEFASYTDNLEEVFDNREQIEISSYYERLPKPTALAIEEYLNGELYFRKPEEDDEINEPAK
ncbi:MAG: DNA-directed RNA polymerase subunit omega [Bacteroidales bacterium]